MRRVKLPDLLIEVDNKLGFTRNFLTPAQREESSPEDICAVLAAVMAHGCNLGVYTMAQLTSDVTYEQLKRIGDWQLTEDAQRSALAELVNAIADLDTSSRWGEGRTAASDGQRFSLPRRVLQQIYSTRFSDFALEFYTFVADNYAPFYSLRIECTDRDAAWLATLGSFTTKPLSPPLGLRAFYGPLDPLGFVGSQLSGIRFVGLTSGTR